MVSARRLCLRVIINPSPLRRAFLLPAEYFWRTSVERELTFAPDHETNGARSFHSVNASLRKKPAKRFNTEVVMYGCTVEPGPAWTKRSPCSFRKFWYTGPLPWAKNSCWLVQDEL